MTKEKDKKIYHRVCKNAKCNKPFKTDDSRKQYCNRKCTKQHGSLRSAMGAVKVICPVCGDKFETTTGHKYCPGKDCAGKAKRGQDKTRVGVAPVDKKIISDEEQKVLDIIRRVPLISIGDLSRRIDRSKETVFKHLDRLNKSGYEIDIDKHKDQVELNRFPSEILKVEKVEPIYRDYVTIGMVSDVHFGSKYQQVHLLHSCYKMFEEEKVDFIIDAGDHFEGSGKMYKGQIQELFLHSADDQKQFALNYQPECRVKGKQIKTHACSGSHDLSFKKDVGYSILKEFAKDRDDYIFHGDIGAKFKIRNTVVDIMHPAGGVPYAKSYRLQKMMEGIVENIIEKYQFGDKDDIPSIVACGHLHITCWVPYANIQCFCVPCLQSQTPYLKAKGLHPKLGCLIIRIYFDDKGLPTKVIQDYRNLNRYIRENSYKEYNF